MSLGASVLLAVVSLISAMERPPVLEAQVVLWRHVPSTAKEWPCTVVLRNVSDRPVKVALKDFAGRYTVRQKTPEGGTMDTIYSEPYIEKDTDQVKYPQGFVSIEPKGVITIPVPLMTLPKIAHQPLEFRIDLFLDVFSEGRAEERRIRCKLRWSPDTGQDGTGIVVQAGETEKE